MAHFKRYQYQTGKGVQRAATFTWGEWLAAASALPRDLSYGDADWAGTRTLGEAVKVGQSGWPEGQRLIQSVALPALAHLGVGATQYGVAAEVCGAALDVGTYMSGVPECWVTPDPIQPRPLVTIGANIAASAAIPTDVLKRRGAAVTALSLALTQAGYAVRVYAVSALPVNQHTGDTTASRVLLTDDAGGPLDTDRVLFALAHPANLRQVCFAVHADMNDCRATGDHLHGVPADPPESLGWKFDLYLPRAVSTEANWRDAASVERWVKAQFAALTTQRD